MSSYLTISPLPIVTEAAAGGIISVALAVTCKSALPLGGILLYGARTFLEVRFATNPAIVSPQAPLVYHIGTNFLARFINGQIALTGYSILPNS